MKGRQETARMASRCRWRKRRVVATAFVGGLDNPNSSCTTMTTYRSRQPYGPKPRQKFGFLVIPQRPPRLANRHRLPPSSECSFLRTSRQKRRKETARDSAFRVSRQFEGPNDFASRR